MLLFVELLLLVRLPSSYPNGQCLQSSHKQSFVELARRHRAMETGQGTKNSTQAEGHKSYRLKPRGSYLSDGRNIFRVEGPLQAGRLSAWTHQLCCAVVFDHAVLRFDICILGPVYETVGAQLAYIAFFVALARSFDVLTDPLMSYFTDAFRSKWGRRRPFMLTGALPYGLLFMFLCMPPRWLGCSQHKLVFWDIVCAIFPGGHVHEHSIRRRCA